MITGSMVENPGNDCRYYESPVKVLWRKIIMILLLANLLSPRKMDGTSVALTSTRCDSPHPFLADRISQALPLASSYSLPRNLDWDILDTEAVQMRRLKG